MFNVFGSLFKDYSSWDFRIKDYTELLEGILSESKEQEFTDPDKFFLMFIRMSIKGAEAFSKIKALETEFNLKTLTELTELEKQAEAEWSDLELCLKRIREEYQKDNKEE